MKKFIEIAEAYIRVLNSENNLGRDLFCVDESPREYFHGWYFDFQFLHVIDSGGGAPGFMVSKVDYSIKVLGWGEFHVLGAKHERLLGLHRMLEQIEEAGWSLALARRLSGMKLKDIMRLKERATMSDMEVDANRILIVREIDELMEGMRG